MARTRVKKPPVLAFKSILPELQSLLPGVSFARSMERAMSSFPFHREVPLTKDSAACFREDSHRILLAAYFIPEQPLPEFCVRDGFGRGPAVMGQSPRRSSSHLASEWANGRTLVSMGNCDASSCSSLPSLVVHPSSGAASAVWLTGLPARRPPTHPPNE